MRRQSYNEGNSDCSAVIRRVLAATEADGDQGDGGP
jgi:hypothetical protein